MKKLILVGARQNLDDIIFNAEALDYEIVGILDHYRFGHVEAIKDIPIIGSENQLLEKNIWQDAEFFLSSWWDGDQFNGTQPLDDEQVRRDRIDILDRSGVTVPNLIHPHWCQFGYGMSTIKLGRGILALPGSQFSREISIGDYSVIDWRCGIGPDTHIKRNVILGANTVSAHVVIEDGARIGVSCTLVPARHGATHLTVGENSIVYIGSTVLEDVPANSVYTMHDRIVRRRAKPINT